MSEATMSGGKMAQRRQIPQVAQVLQRGAHHSNSAEIFCNCCKTYKNLHFNKLA